MFKAIRYYYQFMGRYKTRLVVFYTLLISNGVIESIQPYFLKLFIDSIEQNQYQKILNILLIYLGVKVGAMVLNNLSHLAADWLIIPVSRNIRLKIFQKVQDLDFAYHVKKSSGKLISAFKRGESAVWGLHFDLNYHILGVAINLIVVLVFLSSVQWIFVGLMFASFLVSLATTKFLIENNMRARREFNKTDDSVSGTIVDNLINFETVKLFAKEKWEYSRLKNKFKEWVTRLWNYSYSFRWINLTITALSNIGLFLIMFYGLGQLKKGSLSAGEFIMVLSFTSSFYPRLFEVVYRLRDLAKGKTDLEKYFSILEEETKVKDPKNAQKIRKVRGEIRFENVSFTYPEGKDAVKNLDLAIKPSQSIALVGESGAGKTTIAKLIMRFYDPDEGTIFLDGEDLRNFKKSDLRSVMGIVPQEPIMFNESVAYNIGYGLDGVKQKEIENAAKMANLHDFIVGLPRKYQTIVGERGVKLSGGQKQRLAIARMILSDPEIIIFDEATSQLDSETEVKIQEAFWRAAKGKTTIIIAHRLSTIAKAKRIIVMKNGKIAESGTHKELLTKKDSHYKKFWELQTKKSFS